MIIFLVALTKRTVAGMTLRQKGYPRAQGLAANSSTLWGDGDLHAFG